MTTADKSRAQIIRLSYTDSGRVLVTPDDEDRFVLTAQNAVKACQDQRRSEEAIKRFKSDLIVPLVDWCKRHVDRVHACYIPVPAGFVQVFIVGASSKYDFALGEQVAALELSLFDAGWRVNVLQIPRAEDEDLQTYFNVEGAIQVYAQLEAAPGQGQS